MCSRNHFAWHRKTTKEKKTATLLWKKATEQIESKTVEQQQEEEEKLTALRCRAREEEEEGPNGFPTAPFSAQD